jgi:hypothetical protein
MTRDIERKNDGDEAPPALKVSGGLRIAPPGFGPLHFIIFYPARASALREIRMLKKALALSVVVGFAFAANRGPYGHCRAGGQAGGYGRGRPCPPGWHIGGGGRHCWRN